MMNYDQWLPCLSSQTGLFVIMTGKCKSRFVMGMLNDLSYVVWLSHQPATRGKPVFFISRSKCVVKLPKIVVSV